jgi:acetyl-CoA C-acetyltransferase
MSSGREVVVLSGVRTAIGDYGGALKDVAHRARGHRRARGGQARRDRSAAGRQLVFGNVIHTEAKDMYLSRVACIKGGLPQDTTALTVNRLCGSGLQAIVSAAQSIQLGDADVAVGGGTESMSRGAYILPSLRWGQRMNDGGVVDMMVGALTDPFDTVHMGITAENIAEKWKITREQQDEFAVESHRRAMNAIEKGYFKDQIVPVEVKTRKGTVVVDRDEHPRADATVEGMAKLRRGVQEGRLGHRRQRLGHQRRRRRRRADGGGSGAKAGLKPMARLVAYGLAGVDPKIMGIGPVPACKGALKRAGLSVADMDVIESNEAFAVQALAVSCDLKLRSEKDQPQRRRGRPRTPDRRHRRSADGEGAARAAAHRRTLCARHDVHRRRSGHRGDRAHSSAMRRC